MTVLAFKAGNHPQQTKKGRGDPAKDERYTALSYFRPLHERWGFTVDAAGCEAAPASRLVGRWWDKAANGLEQPWNGECVWCNPPYSSIRPWVEKAWASLAVVAMLLPANRTEQPWWQELVEPYRDHSGGILRAKFEDGRAVFGTPEHPDADTIAWNSSAPFGVVLLTWTRPERGDLLFVPSRDLLLGTVPPRPRRKHKR
jgi:hypothetical protein